MASAKPRPIRLDTSAAAGLSTGASPLELAGLGPRLESLRDDLLAQAERCSDNPLPTTGGAAFVLLAQQMLSEYEQHRHTSPLGRMLALARRMADEMDRLVVVARGGILLAVRALTAACCHPLHNELSRGERGARPRVYFAGDSLDNDSLQALLDVLGRDTAPRSVEQQWGLVVADGDGGQLPCVMARQVLHAALVESMHGNRAAAANRVAVVSGEHTPLFDWANQQGVANGFLIPPDVTDAGLALSAAALLPLAILGVDVVSLLRGAQNMTNKFRALPAAENPILQYAGVSYLLRVERGIQRRACIAWTDSLQAAGQWYQHLLETWPTPLPVATASTLGTPTGTLGGSGDGDCLVVNVAADHVRRDRLPLQRVDGREAPTDDTLDRLAASALAAWRQQAIVRHLPALGVTLPLVDENAMGQLLQLLLLATAIESRLAGA